VNNFRLHEAADKEYCITGYDAVSLSLLFRIPEVPLQISALQPVILAQVIGGFLSPSM
jgi:hypothetical protein